MCVCVCVCVRVCVCVCVLYLVLIRFVSNCLKLRLYASKQECVCVRATLLLLILCASFAFRPENEECPVDLLDSNCLVIKVIL